MRVAGTVLAPKIVLAHPFKSSPALCVNDSTVVHVQQKVPGLIFELDDRLDQELDEVVHLRLFEFCNVARQIPR